MSTNNKYLKGVPSRYESDNCSTVNNKKGQVNYTFALLGGKPVELIDVNSQLTGVDSSLLGKSVKSEDPSASV